MRHGGNAEYSLRKGVNVAKKRIINAPSKQILDMLKKRTPHDFRTLLDQFHVDAVGLIMVSIPDLYFYADVASKSANVVVSEVFGSCPQHVNTLAIFGEIAAVQAAMQSVEEIEISEQSF